MELTMANIPLVPAVVTGIAAALIFVIAEFAPWVGTWFGGLTPSWKGATMFFSNLGLVALFVLMGCNGILFSEVPCGNLANTLIFGALLLFDALTMNQVTHRLFKKRA